MEKHVNLYLLSWLKLYRRTHLYTGIHCIGNHYYESAKSQLLRWQQQFSTEEDCLADLKKIKWLNRSTCPYCAHNRGYEIRRLRLYKCPYCKKQTSMMAGTLFHGRHIFLVKWLLAISDKGSMCALRLSKLIEMNWRTARLILKKLRVAMSNRDSLYQLSGKRYHWAGWRSDWWQIERKTRSRCKRENERVDSMWKQWEKSRIYRYGSGK